MDISTAIDIAQHPTSHAGHDVEEYILAAYTIYLKMHAKDDEHPALNALNTLIKRMTTLHMGTHTGTVCDEVTEQVTYEKFEVTCVACLLDMEN